MAADPGPVTLLIDTQLWTQNSLRRLNHYAAAELIRNCRYTAKIVALEHKVPRYSVPITISATPLQRRGKLSDVGNYYPPVKAIIDGLVDAGVLPDDGPTVVVGLFQWAPRRPQAGEREGVEITLRPQRQKGAAAPILS